MKVSTDLFIMGVTLGWGPCLSFCLPILIPYIAASEKGWFRGFKAGLVFSLSRIIPYMLLALAASLFGQLVVNKYYETGLGLFIYLSAGLFILITGLLILLTKHARGYLCLLRSNEIRQRGYKGLVLLGLLVGFSPCIPLLGVLSYIAMTSKNALQGIFYGACFGTGTLFSPLIMFSSLAGGLPPFIFRRQRLYSFFSRLCGLFLIYLGIKMLMGALK